MARLQILELPNVERPDGTEETPFILVIDEVDEAMRAEIASWPDGIASRIGARQVLCVSETVEIPANEVPVDPDGHPLKIRIEGDFEQFREQVKDEIRNAQANVTRAVQDARLRAASEEGWTGRPTRPYGYSEITAGGWEACEGCRTWGQWNTQNPHDCPGTYIKGPMAKPAADA
jgi:hypothetical protein